MKLIDYIRNSVINLDEKINKCSDEDVKKILIEKKKNYVKMIGVCL